MADNARCDRLDPRRGKSARSGDPCLPSPPGYVRWPVILAGVSSLVVISAFPGGAAYSKLYPQYQQLPVERRPSSP